MCAVYKSNRRLLCAIKQFSIVLRGRSLADFTPKPQHVELKLCCRGFQSALLTEERSWHYCRGLCGDDSLTLTSHLYSGAFEDRTSQSTSTVSPDPTLLSTVAHSQGMSRAATPMKSSMGLWVVYSTHAVGKKNTEILMLFLKKLQKKKKKCLHSKSQSQKFQPML